MKGGLLTGLYALLALRALGTDEDEDEVADLPFERLVFVANPDEEIGSPSSTPHIRELALEADACFVLECARANGDIVSARKGIVDLRLTVHGRAAHAGVEPEKGRSAILEAAHQVIALHALNGRWPGVTANVGVDPRRHPAQRRRRGGRPRGRPPGDDPARTSRRPRPPSAAIAAATTVPDVSGRRSRRWAATGRWRSSSDPAGWSTTPSRIADRLGFHAGRLRDRRRVGRQHDVRAGRADARRARADRRQRPLARRSTSRSTRSCRGRRCSRRSCWRSPATRSWRRGGRTGLSPRRRPPAHLDRRPVGGERRLQPRGRRRRRVLGLRHDRRRAGRPVASTRAIPAPRPGPPSTSSSAALAEAASRSPTSSGRGCT